MPTPHQPPPSAAPSTHPTNQPQEAARFRRALLEDLLLSLPRSAYYISEGTTDPTARQEEAALGFVLLEGLRRVVAEAFGGQQQQGGCELVRYLRPLTQVLAMQPLEEGGVADRCAF